MVCGGAVNEIEFKRKLNESILKRQSSLNIKTEETSSLELDKFLNDTQNEQTIIYDLGNRLDPTLDKLLKEISNNNFEIIAALFKIYKCSLINQKSNVPNDVVVDCFDYFLNYDLFFLVLTLFYCEEKISTINDLVYTKKTNESARKKAYSDTKKAILLLEASLISLGKIAPTARPHQELLLEHLNIISPKILASEYCEIPLIIKRPGNNDAQRLFMLKELKSYFSRTYKTPLNNCNLAITSIFFDCSKVTIQDIAKLKVPIIEPTET